MFVNVAVYVIISPIDTIVRSASKSVVTVALLICVEALLEVIVPVTGGDAGSTMNSVLNRCNVCNWVGRWSRCNYDLESND